MYKLILFIMLCMWSVSSDADRRCMQTEPVKVNAEVLPEVLEFMNPFQFSR